MLFENHFEEFLFARRFKTTNGGQLGILCPFLMRKLQFSTLETLQNDPSNREAEKLGSFKRFCAKSV